LIKKWYLFYKFIFLFFIENENLSIFSFVFWQKLKIILHFSENYLQIIKNFC